MSEHQAFDALFGPLVEPAYRLAYTMLLDREAAEDAVQDAAISAWRHRSRFRHGADPRPWFFCIVANQCRSVRRARWWSVLKGVEIEAQAGSPLDGLAPRLDLRNAMLQLGPRDRALLVLHYHDGLTLEEAATSLGMSGGAAKSRLHRSLRRLRTELGIAEVPAR
jgi:RNA polymerase sigma-70 factor (ECF subfamily)